jgi:hypothetical protein
LLDSGLTHGVLALFGRHAIAAHTPPAPGAAGPRSCRRRNLSLVVDGFASIADAISAVRIGRVFRSSRIRSSAAFAAFAFGWLPPDERAGQGVEAIKALEDAGVLSWVHRLKRLRERCGDVFAEGFRIVPARTSSGY